MFMAAAAPDQVKGLADQDYGLSVTRWKQPPLVSNSSSSYQGPESPRTTYRGKRIAKPPPPSHSPNSDPPSTLFRNQHSRRSQSRDLRSIASTPASPSSSGTRSLKSEFGKSLRFKFPNFSKKPTMIMFSRHGGGSVTPDLSRQRRDIHGNLVPPTATSNPPTVRNLTTNGGSVQRHSIEYEPQRPQDDARQPNMDTHAPRAKEELLLPSQRKISKLEAALQKATQKCDDLDAELRAKDERIERLRVQLNEEGKKAHRPPASLSALQVPEAEIGNMWASLSWKVHNFVLVHLKKLDKAEIQGWEATGPQGLGLEQVSPNCKQLALDKRARLWFVEAAIWNVLDARVFDHRNACWAGKYRKNLEGLNMSLRSDVMPDVQQQDAETQENQKRKFHRWKAVTTDLLHSLDPQAKDSGVGKLIRSEVASALELLLESFAGRSRPKEAVLLLDGIVSDAIALDHVFNGQQGCYQAIYPGLRHGVDLTLGMDAVEGCSLEATVQFVIRPGLWRCGVGSERYNQFTALSPALVWTS